MGTENYSHSKPAFTWSKLAIEKLEQSMKYVQKKQNDAILFRIRTEYGEILYLSVFSPNARKYGVVLVSLLLTFTPCLLAGLGSSKR